MGNILFESVILTACGVCVGFLLTFAAIRYLDSIYPLLTIEVTPRWMITAALLGISGGVVGALYPAFLAVRQDPVKALSYE
jgi:ABC-type antimicrobial peptide transport system permease subunit